MKIFVLVTLLTLQKRTLAEDIYCKTVADWSGTVELVDESEVCAAAKCSRPKFAGGSYALESDGTKWGCGECTTRANCVECTTDRCNMEAIKCYTSKDADTSAVETCPDTAGGVTAEAATECRRPKVTSVSGDYSTSENAAWGCGCTDEDQCVKTEGSLSNTPVEPKHTCRKYTKADTSGAKWEMVADTTKTDCYQIDGGTTLEGCKMPTPDAAGSAGEYDHVCGNDCGDAAAGTCKGCDTADCNVIDAAATRYCKVGPGDTEEADVAGLPLNFCDDDSKCKRPKVSYGALVDATVGYACGDCTTDETGKGCVECSGSDCNGWPADVSINCFPWEKKEGGTEWTVADTATACIHDDGDATCNMPKDVKKVGATDYTGNGCGLCAGADTGCMEAAAEKNKQLIKCYTWSKDGDKWVPTTDAKDCTLGAGEAKCNLPKDRNKIDGYTGDGCGACASDEEGCMSTEPEKNAARHVVLSLFVSLIPLLYVLL